jgi:hypothetical protein
VAGHAVSFDAERQLWFCDIDIDMGDAYYPFIRLALARFHPKSLPRPKQFHLPKIAQPNNQPFLGNV